ncbi:MAG: hypothetical protein GEU78_16465 [Actinobacteria bacterium]|nr:hypothetical protein [Actinomycetota bacterium]
MLPFRWVLRDANGADLRASEEFASKDEAEAWMGAEWAALAAEGAERVVLMDGDDIVYDMSLRPE